MQTFFFPHITIENNNNPNPNVYFVEDVNKKDLIGEIEEQMNGRKTIHIMTVLMMNSDGRPIRQELELRIV